jgi:hypothetical protein
MKKIIAFEICLVAATMALYASSFGMTVGLATALVAFALAVALGFDLNVSATTASALYAVAALLYAGGGDLGYVALMLMFAVITTVGTLVGFAYIPMGLERIELLMTVEALFFGVGVICSMVFFGSLIPGALGILVLVLVALREWPKPHEA